MRLLAFGWLVSLAGAFHLGWWLRHRMTMRLKADCKRAVEEAVALNASPSVIEQMKRAYWDSI